MARPTGWDVVDQRRDPTPGEAHGVRMLRNGYRDLADEAASAARTLRSIKTSTQDSGVWYGRAAATFVEQIGDFPEMLDKCANSYRDVVGALDTWRTQLELHQSAADKSLANAKTAASDLAAGREDETAAKKSFTLADDALTEALQLLKKWEGKTPPDNVTLPTDYRISQLRSTRKARQAALSDATGDVSDAKARLASATRLVAEAKADYGTAAKQAATTIRAARAKAIPKDSIWKKITGSKAWQILVTVVTVVLVVAVVLALVLTGAGAAIALAVVAVAGAILTADDVAQFMAGNMSGAEFAIAMALNFIPGGKAGKAIVNGLKRVVAPLAKVAGALGDLKKVTGPVMAKLTAGLRAAGSRIDEHFALVRKEWRTNPDAGRIRLGPRDAVTKHLDDMVIKFDDLARDTSRPAWQRKMFEGTRFNWENYGRYSYREVSVKVDGKTYRLDSYVPGKEIVSRKHTQLAQVKEDTAVSYVREMTTKYNPLRKGEITSAVPSQAGVAGPGTLKGGQLRGDMYLEVPVQKAPIPEAVLKAARDATPPIMIRDIHGKVYR